MPTCSQCDVYRTLLTSAHFCHLEARFAHLRGSSSGPRCGVFSLVLAQFPSQALFGCLLNLQASLQSIFGNLRRSNLRDFNALASNRLAVRVRRIAQLGHQLYTGSAWAGPAARRRFLSDVPFGRFPEHSLAMYPLVRFDGASLAMYPLGGFDGASLSTYPCYRRSFAARTLTFVPFPSFWLSSPPCGPKTLTYVTFLGFQPEGRESPDRRFPKSVAEFFL